MSNPVDRYTSPLRYPGGKAKLANFVKLLLVENGLAGCEYVEPYAGGAAVALTLLYEGYVSRVRINDLNAGVHAFWHGVLHDTERFCSMVATIPLTVAEWRRQREVYQDQASSMFDLGFATFYLNRVNRSGIVGGGLIGGLDQGGDWTMDARFPRAELIRRIQKVARFRSRISLTRLDAVDLLRSLADSGGPASLVYLDPPYYVKGERLYDNFYTHQDHIAVRDAVVALKHPWIVSYDAAPEILEMYHGWPTVRYSLDYSAAARTEGREVMFSSPSLAIPDLAPSAVRRAHVRERLIAG
jgi:DNA adenine methylase